MVLILCTDRQHEEDSVPFLKRETDEVEREKWYEEREVIGGGVGGILFQILFVYRYEILKQ